MDAAILDDIHRFWFGEITSPEDRCEEMREKWFKQSDDFDEEINTRFGRYLDEAAATDWELGALTRTQAVGLVILLDQFPRNLFRDTGQAFAYDARAREIVRGLIAQDIDRFYNIERGFLYMPFMHSEEIRDQDQCVALFAREALTAPESLVEDKRSRLDYAFWHRDLIRKFGRFPHRNTMMGRESTEEEKKHLAERGRGF